MAHGIGEPLSRNIDTHLQAVSYPTSREELVLAAEDGDAPLEVINFLKALPHAAYLSLRQVHRDFAEAARRMGSWAPQVQRH